MKHLSVKLHKMKLKVCGMRDKQNLTDLLEIGPDYIGFIFFEKSKRNVTDFPNVQVPSEIKKVGVFVNETHEMISEKVQEHNLKAVQLHGDETPEFCSELRKALPEIEIFKAFSVDESFDFDTTKPYEAVCDVFVFDTKGKERGGNGVKFDWELLSNYKGETPYLLSGGISLEDIDLLNEFAQSSIAKNCLGVDVNSGFESEPGLKKIEELKQFKEILP